MGVYFNMIDIHLRHRLFQWRPRSHSRCSHTNRSVYVIWDAVFSFSLFYFLFLCCYNMRELVLRDCCVSEFEVSTRNSCLSCVGIDCVYQTTTKTTTLLILLRTTWKFRICSTREFIPIFSTHRPATSEKSWDEKQEDIRPSRQDLKVRTFKLFK